ncbi:hypothetical protein BpHYR1_009653 [Brachionus plicatilis]|uniref:Uncharacterized protein n=1 Tax=Brachionus plicatilis TaxID=10195 RepID=A0A3M7PRP4_BRAPC|nr:hypothetical protein BpHYR1_009653 [Brachionus plicatilis]
MDPSSWPVTNVSLSIYSIEEMAEASEQAAIVSLGRTLKHLILLPVPVKTLLQLPSFKFQILIKPSSEPDTKSPLESSPKFAILPQWPSICDHSFKFFRFTDFDAGSWTGLHSLNS